MEIVLRATVIFWFLWIVTRGMGKRELAEMSPFELILLVTMGDLVQQGVTQEDFSLTGAALAISTLAIWVLVSAAISRRSQTAKRVLDGTPVLLLRDGEFLETTMGHEGVDEDDVKEAARNQGIADLATVRIAILEPDGRFSFLKDERTEGGSPDPQQPPERHR
jgi:uncharacterized membrane protein YcaP (DUF421 family)